MAVRPGAPLLAIDRAKVAILVGPFVPDGDAVVVEIFDVGVAGQEPQELMDDRLQMQLLGGGDGKTVGKVKAHLVAEHRTRPGAGAIATISTVFQHMLQKVEILAHRFRLDSIVEAL